MTSAKRCRTRALTAIRRIVGAGFRGPVLVLFSVLAAASPGGARTADLCDETHAGWKPTRIADGARDLDLSGLNHRPAGKHGFLQAAGDDLAFADGTPARFWGANLVAGTLFESSDAEIAWHAEQLAKLGFNLVRFHHHDSMRWVNPSVLDEQRSDSQHLDLAAMERLDRWIHALRTAGIYVWLDMHTGRVFGPGDEIPDFNEVLGADPSGEAKGFNYLNPRIEALMAEFQEAFLGHVNPYTGLRYADDPAIAFALVTNENDFTDHFGRDFIEHRFPGHQLAHDRGLREFAREHNLPAERMLDGSARGALNLWRNEVEHRFNERMLAALRGVGFRGMAATTSLWGNARFHSLPPLADGDLIDVHSYGAPGWIKTDPRDAPNFALRIATGQVLGRPVSVSEWNIGEPLASDRFLSPMYLASVASFQGWDAPMLYAYAQGPFQSPREARPWTSFPDPAVMGLMPAAAVLFREQHVARGAEVHVIEPPRDVLLNEWRDVWQTPALRTLVERHRVAIRLPKIKELDWWKPAELPEGAVRVRDLDRSFLASDGSLHTTESDTGELKRDWRDAVFRVETPRSLVASGAHGGRNHGFANAQIRIRNESATVAVTSLDGKPIDESDRLLLSAVGPSCAVDEPGPTYRSEPVRGSVWLRRKPTLPEVAAGPPDAPPAATLVAGEEWVEVPLDGGPLWRIVKPSELVAAKVDLQLVIPEGAKPSPVIPIEN